jgi:hypothetical protein
MTQPDTDARLLRSIQELAARTGISVTTLHDQAAQGTLPRLPLSG